MFEVVTDRQTSFSFHGESCSVALAIGRSFGCVNSFYWYMPFLTPTLTLADEVTVYIYLCLQIKSGRIYQAVNLATRVAPGETNKKQLIKSSLTFYNIYVK